MALFRGTIARTPRLPLVLVVAWVVEAATAVSRGIDGGYPRPGENGGGLAEGGRKLLALNGEEIKERAKELYAEWARIYGLDNASSLLPPPSPLPFPPAVPPAPHLEDCSARTAWRHASEARGPGDEPPLWARGRGGAAQGAGERGGEGCGEGPWPPWVRGADVDNLPLTRVAQRDIWESQRIGAGCDGRRLLVARWWPGVRHGLGSQVHLAGAYLSIAMAHNRTFVPWPGQFDRALDQSCQGLGQRGDWECFYFPIASADCTHRVQQALASRAMPACASRGFSAAAASEATIVCVEQQQLGELFMAQGSEAASLWGAPYLSIPPTVEHWGQMQGMTANESMTHWWRAQATRFMMRWPSAHLCHVSNQQRHAAFGPLVANQLATFAPTQSAFLRPLTASNAVSEADFALLSAMGDSSPSLPLSPSGLPPSDSSSSLSSFPSSFLSAKPPAPAPASPPEPPQLLAVGASPPLSSPLLPPETVGESTGESMGESTGESARVVEAEAPPPVRTLASTVWTTRGFPVAFCSHYSCDAGASSSSGGGGSSSSRGGGELGAEEAYRMVGGEVHVPRGMVSLHVRQTDKGREMRLASFHSHMFLLLRLKRSLPNLQFVWLNTEAQSVIDATSLHPDWTFFYSTNSRQGDMSAHQQPQPKEQQQQQQQQHEEDLRAYDSEQSVAVSFASLLIAAHCDVFVGSLGSNWSRLINELRSTNGRLLAGFVALNLGEY
ncbi:hypothetical protein CLOM_g17221 [Closterium sp. NIES-68]|nr:hypothetical protein CLOM_g17221 [Closterium sp. NIES-68]GJP67256.1 hypothetical protein CLOP_g24098 [Closterium sp. NIES-67]